VHPDDESKPPLGEGLNRRAQVTLDRVYPVNKQTRQPITDPETMSELKYEDHLRNTCLKMKVRFLEYRPDTGSWVFKVILYKYIIKD
jgi:nuclear pore complex protein Nup98-Nup96